MLDKEKVKTEYIRFGVTQADKATIAAAAKNEGISISEFIRKAIKQYLKENK